MIDWAATRDALRAWVVAGAALRTASVGENVIWAEQNAPRPDTKPYVELSIAQVQFPATPWLDLVDDADPDVVNFAVRGMARCRLQIQVFSDDTFGDDGPEAIMQTILAARGLPSIDEALDTAGIGVTRFEPVISAGGVVGLAAWEPRAIASVHFNVGSTLTEAGSPIQTVDINKPPDT